MKYAMANFIESWSSKIVRKLRGKRVVICGYCYKHFRSCDHPLEYRAPLKVYRSQIIGREKDGRLLFDWDWSKNR